MSGVQMALAGSSSGGIQAFSVGLSNNSVATGIRSASFTLVSDGTSTRTPNGGGSAVAGPNWYAPTTASIGSSYWVKLVINSSATTTISGSATNTVMSVSGAGWTFTNTATNNEGTGSGTLSFYTDSGGTNLVATGSVSWDVGYTP